MQQQVLDLGTTLKAARSAGEEGIRAAAESAGPAFLSRAQNYVVLHLRKHGPTSSEMLTDACKAAGIRTAEDRAFGAVYAALSRAGLIEKAGDCKRAKGHGTAGGILWRLTPKRRRT
jgi:hypothetical protein